MMWDRDDNRLAILELYTYGHLHLRQSQTEAWRWLSELPWTRRTGRRDEFALVEDRRGDLERLLTQVWPEWRDALARLEAAGLPVSERGWREILDKQRGVDLPLLPPRLNLRTAAAQVGPHSKASLSTTRREALAEVDLTRDGIVRMRPNNGLLVQRGESSIDAERLADLTGEVVVTERAFVDGTTLAGILPRAVLLVENLGPYLDLAAPSGWLVVHVPGWNTATVRVLLDRLGDVPLVHFGDLDPNGVRIAAHLRTARPGLRWAVPDFWREHVPGRTQRLAWPEDLVWIDAPDLVRELAQAGLWLEQETIALDPRLRNALEQVLGT